MNFTTKGTKGRTQKAHKIWRGKKSSFLLSNSSLCLLCSSLCAFCGEIPNRVFRDSLTVHEARYVPNLLLSSSRPSRRAGKAAAHRHPRRLHYQRRETGRSGARNLLRRSGKDAPTTGPASRSDERGHRRRKYPGGG